jgi:hypothetical protein
MTEYWNDPLRRPHPIGCHCAPDGRCEQAQAVAEEAAERRAYPYEAESGWGPTATSTAVLSPTATGASGHPANRSASTSASSRALA